MRQGWLITQRQKATSSWRASVGGGQKRVRAASGGPRRWLRPAAACAIVAVAAGTWFAASALNARARIKAHYAVPPSIPFPADNPFTAAKADLGRTLFFDPCLSGSGTISCAGCHQARLGWSDGRPLAIGDGGDQMARRAPTLIDVAWLPIYGWDGRFPTLEAVTFGAITARGNMNLTEAEALRRLAADPAYVRAFAQVFPDHQISSHNVAAAIATFERLIVSKPDSPFDRWIGGDANAISPAAKRGFDLFNGRAHCASCHAGWEFTDGSFHDIGLPATDDIGRGTFFPTSQSLKHAFKTPTLRGVAQRGPYMHDGSVRTLPEVIDLYDRGGVVRPSRDPLIGPLHLTAAEKSDLLAFLETLSGAVSSSDEPPIPPASPLTGQGGSE